MSDVDGFEKHFDGEYTYYFKRSPGLESSEPLKLLRRRCMNCGIGYWQLMRTLIPENFYNMAKVEHDLTDLKGEPVTMLKDQGKNGGLVFLLPHPKYPDVKDISMMKGRPPKPLMECNGFCGVNDLEKNVTESEINFS